MNAEGVMSAPSIHFVIKFGKFGLLYFYVFATDSYGTSLTSKIRHDKSKDEAKLFLRIKKKRNNKKSATS